MGNFDGLFWLLLLLGPLLLSQRKLHREIQAVFLLITRRADISLVLFSLIFLPGVFLHELSHFVMALVLQVRTGRFSLVPRTMPDGRLQLGYVETASTDFVRDALIGFAPLLAGSLFVTYAGVYRMGLPAVWDEFLSGNTARLSAALSALPNQPDFWLWFYLICAVSSTMLPSASDRRAWLPMIVAIAILIILATITGAGPWMAANLAPILNKGLRTLAMVMGISVALQCIFLLPIWILRQILSRLTGMEVA